MTFLEHLEELRGVIIHSVIALLVAAVAAWFVSRYVLDWLIEFTMPEGVPVVFLSPAEAFVNQLKVALAIAMMVALPYVAARMWQFIMPGLLASERRAILPLSVASTLLFYLGILFAFLALVPVAIKILLAFGTGNLVPTIAIGALLGFILKLCLACGLVFQMPLVIAVLTHLGLVSPEWLLSRWRYAVLIIFLTAAILTPADAASQMLLGLPVTGLFFLSVGVSKVIARRRREAAAAADDREDGEDDDRAGVGDDDGDDDGGDDDGDGDDDGGGDDGGGDDDGGDDGGGSGAPGRAVPRAAPVEIDDSRARGPGWRPAGEPPASTPGDPPPGGSPRQEAP
jgi:sec-independent protein translocase protein TatC